MSKILEAAAEYARSPHHGADMETTHDGAFLAGVEFARGWVQGRIDVWEARVAELEFWASQEETSSEVLARTYHEIEVWKQAIANLKEAMA